MHSLQINVNSSIEYEQARTKPFRKEGANCLKGKREREKEKKVLASKRGAIAHRTLPSDGPGMKVF